MPKVTVLATVVAKKDLHEKVKNELMKLIDPSRKDEGCIEYRLHQDNENPHFFYFYENWEDEISLNKHMDTPHFKRFAANIGELTDDINVKSLTMLDS